MPHAPARACRYSRCPMLTRDASGFCEVHRHLSNGYDASRPSPAERGYGPQWRRIRERVLKEHGIPMHDWHLYDIDHEPPYAPSVEPDHMKYRLTPRLHAEHSSKTAARDGGFGNTKARGAR